MRRFMLFVALIGLLLFGACSDDSPTVESDGDDAAGEEADESEIQKFSFEAKEYGYSVPSKVNDGTVEFTMKNVGKEIHIAALGRVKDGRTFAEAAKDLQSPTPPENPAADDSAFGGIASTSPGGSSTVTLLLQPGTYYFACFIPGPDGAPHTAKGMVESFEVVDVDVAPAAAPTPAGKVVGKEFSYTTDYKVKAGEQVIEFVNEGTQGHEITLLEFAAGKGPADLQAFFENPTGAPPATFYGGPVAGFASVTWRTPKLVAGKSYFFMCLIPDEDGVPHAAKGMVLPVSVT